MKRPKVEWKEIDGEKWVKFNKDFDRWKYFYGTLTGFLMLILLAVFVFIFYFGVYNHIDAFTANPLLYGTRVIEDFHDNPVSCSCFVSDAYNTVYTWNASGFKRPEQEKEGFHREYVNFSILLGGSNS